MNDTHRLRSLQATFARAVLEREYIPAAGVFGEHGLSARQRLDVYHNQARLAEAGALEAVYPAVRRLLGDDYFANMAVLYGRRYPLSQGDLRLFGEHLAEFVARFQPLHSLPYIADVARLEWCWHQSHHAPQAPSDASASNGTHLCLAPHVRLLQSPFPVASIWDFALREHPDGTVRLNIDGIGPEHVLIMRPTLDVEVWTLPREEWEWLSGYREPTRRADEAHQAGCQGSWLARRALMAATR